MKLKNKKNIIRVKALKDKFLFINHNEHTSKLLDTPNTAKEFSSLYNRGFKDAYINLSMIIGLVVLAWFFIMMFIVF